MNIKNFTKNIIDIENLARAELILDQDKMIKSVKITSENLFGIKLSANLSNTSFPKCV